MAWPKYPSQTELLTAKALASEATAPLAALTEELTGLREQLDAARQALDALATSLEQKVAGNKQGPDMGWTHPDEPADQLRREVGYVIEDARAALGVEGPAAGDGQP